MDSVKITYYSKDSKYLVKMKQFYAYMVCMLDLKSAKMWWEEDEKEFKELSGIDSDDNTVLKVLRKLEKDLGLESYETIRNIKEK